MVFKASDVQPPGYPTVVATENLGKKLEAATNGRLSIQMYPSMQLGGEKETIEQTQIGAIQMLRVSVGAMGPIVDDINVVNMPFLFKSTAHSEKMMDGPIGQAARENYRERQCRAGRAVLDEFRRTQPLQYQEAHQIGRRPQGPENPRHRQPDFRRHDERPWRQWRCDGL
jgi:TRAP-type C4-dicarboxylate transport system substrate-binding protein